MQYLGALSGVGMLTCAGETVARAEYDIDGYADAYNHVAGSGEVRMPAAILQVVLRRGDVQIITEGGRRLDLKFSDRHLPVSSDAAHVDVSGELPALSEWGC